MWPICFWALVWVVRVCDYRPNTISRIVEAKPEELRIFLEEAAGISKYKERRRETELRLRDTRENLTRVEDICRELQKQINKLKCKPLWPSSSINCKLRSNMRTARCQAIKNATLRD